MREPKKGDIAVCSLGAVGLITKDGRHPVYYEDGSMGEAYVGIHLTDKLAPIGRPWSSRNPKVIASVNEIGVTLHG